MADDRLRRALERIAKGAKHVPTPAGFAERARTMAIYEALGEGIAVYAAHVLAAGDPDAPDGYEPREKRPR